MCFLTKNNLDPFMHFDMQKGSFEFLKILKTQLNNLELRPKKRQTHTLDGHHFCLKPRIMKPLSRIERADNILTIVSN